MLIEVVVHVRGVAREVVHGVGVRPLRQAGLGLRGLLHGQTSHLHAVYIHVWIQSSCGREREETLSFIICSWYTYFSLYTLSLQQKITPTCEVSDAGCAPALVVVLMSHRSTPSSYALCQ